MTKKIKILIGIIVVMLIIYGALLVMSNIKAKNPQAGVFDVKSLFPSYGSNQQNNQPAGEVVENPGTFPDQSAPDTTIQHLFLLSDQMIAGSGIIARQYPRPVDPNAPIVPVVVPKKGVKPAPLPPTPMDTKYFVRFAEKATSHINEWSAETKIVSRISNTTIPKIQEAYFNSTGNNVLLRYFNEGSSQIDTYGALIVPGKTKDELGHLIGNFFPYNISDLVVAPSKNRVFYVYPVNGDTVGTTSDFDGGNKKQVLSSKFSEWMPGWATPTAVTVTTKASRYFPGFMYAIPTTTSLNRIIGNITGLATLMSPDGTEVLYSDTTGVEPHLYIYNIKDGTKRDSGLHTLADKCAWASDSISFYCGVPAYFGNDILPDAWYQGTVSFSDELWRMNVNANVSNVVLTPNNESHDFDITNIEIAQDQSLVTFIDKGTLTLWALEM